VLLSGSLLIADRHPSGSHCRQPYRETCQRCRSHGQMVFETSFSRNGETPLAGSHTRTLKYERFGRNREFIAEKLEPPRVSNRHPAFKPRPDRRWHREPHRCPDRACIQRSQDEPRRPQLSLLSRLSDGPLSNCGGLDLYLFYPGEALIAFA
jgi:hypothetical protein